MKQNDWISTKEALPKNSYTLPFFIIVKNENDECCRIITSEWSTYTDVGDAFTYWKDANLNGTECRIRQPIPMDRVLYWKPVEKLPDDIKDKVIITQYLERGDYI